MKQQFEKLKPINSRFKYRLFIGLFILFIGLIHLSSAEASTANRLGKDVKVILLEKLTNLPTKKIVINIPSRTLTLYEWGLPITSWPVGLGRSNFKTPTGSYNILFKIKKPTWISPYDQKLRIGPGPDNPLGTRWMEFKQDPTGDYGIHGTNSPLSVGQFSSHGCVRMRIPDAEALFDKVPVRTPVEIVYNQVVSWEKNNNIYIRVYADYYKKGKPMPQKILTELEAQYAGAKIDQETLTTAPNGFQSLTYSFD